MLRTNERESEILLGNKQLLGIFFAVALLLGVAFYGGYMVGRRSSGKKASAVAGTAVPATANSQNVTAGETHTIPGESPGSAEESKHPLGREPVVKSSPGSHGSTGSSSSDAPLGSHKTKAARESKVPAAADPEVAAGG